MVLGDPGVGKTSLIIAATESFDPSPPACLPPTRLPPNFEGIPLLAIDTSDRSENRQSIDAQIEGVDVILLCYSVDMPDSIRHIRTYWLPELRRHNSTIPIVVCGCRMDLAPDEMAFESQRKFLEELLKEYREVETAIECSARCMQYVQEVFHFALKAVCHPQFPLYDTINQRLKPRCSQALKRVFLLCDRDKDNLLDEEELNDFQVTLLSLRPLENIPPQVKVFWAPLQPEELEGVLNAVASKLPSGVQDNSFTVNGFLYLHAMLMEQGRYETTWIVLRKFGYTNDLTLSNDLLDCVPFDHSPDQVTSLQTQKTFAKVLPGTSIVGDGSEVPDRVVPVAG